MNAYKQPDVGKSRSIFTPGATAAGCCCCFISEDSLSHPDLSLWLAWPSSPWRSVLPVSGPASSYLSFLSSVPVFVVSFDPTFIARCGICDSLREPTTVRTFLFQTRLLFSLLFGSAPFSFFSPPLSLSLSCFLCSLPFFLRLCPSSFFYPFPFSVRFSVGFSADFSAGTSVRATFARGPGGSFSSFGHRLRIIGFLHRVHGDESGDIFVADVVSDRLAFLSNLTAPGQLEHSSTGVIQFACCCTRRVRSGVSRGKINRPIGL